MIPYLVQPPFDLSGEQRPRGSQAVVFVRFVAIISYSLIAADEKVWFVTIQWIVA